jgi:membrane-associated phospholipid phosphatase
MFPVAVPRSWRSINGNQSISTKFLSLVQRFDARTNCFPSMHVSVATLTAFHISLNQPLSAPWIFLFPLFISMSALFTKQHYFLDLPAGMLLGWLVFEFYLIYAHLT